MMKKKSSNNNKMMTTRHRKMPEGTGMPKLENEWKTKPNNGINIDKLAHIINNIEVLFEQKIPIYHFVCAL